MRSPGQLATCAAWLSSEWLRQRRDPKRLRLFITEAEELELQKLPAPIFSQAFTVDDRGRPHYYGVRIVVMRGLGSAVPR